LVYYRKLYFEMQQLSRYEQRLELRTSAAERAGFPAFGGKSEARTERGLSLGDRAFRNLSLCEYLRSKKSEKITTKTIEALRLRV